MYLPRRAVEEFRAIWLEEYGEELSFEDAQMRAERFLSAFRLLYLTPRPPVDEKKQSD